MKLSALLTACCASTGFARLPSVRRQGPMEGPIDGYIYQAVNDSTPHIDTLVSTIQTASSQQVTSQLQYLTGRMNTLATQIYDQLHPPVPEGPGPVVRPVHDSLIQLVQGWSRVISALYSKPDRQTWLPSLASQLREWAGADAKVLQNLDEYVQDEANLTRSAASGVSATMLDELDLSRLRPWLAPS